MMTDMDIKDAVYSWLSESPLVGEVSGSLYKDQRPLNSEVEDVTIAVLSGTTGQTQETVVNVNVYVPDLRREREYVEDGVRLRVLERMCMDYMEYRKVHGAIFELERQEVFSVDDAQLHVIGNRLRIRFNTED